MKENKSKKDKKDKKEKKQGKEKKSAPGHGRGTKSTYRPKRRCRNPVGEHDMSPSRHESDASESNDKPAPKKKKVDREKKRGDEVAESHRDKLLQCDLCKATSKTKAWAETQREGTRNVAVGTRCKDEGVEQINSKQQQQQQ